MAQRRMFSKSVLGRDDFISLPSDAAKLYLYLNVYADDDGFIQAPRGTAAFAGVDVSALETLEKAGFIIRFPSGAVVIRHWHQQNYLRKDTYTPTVCREELAMLVIDESGVYVPAPAVSPSDLPAAVPAASSVASPAASSAVTAPAASSPAASSPVVSAVSLSAENADIFSENSPSTQVSEEKKRKEKSSKAKQLACEKLDMLTLEKAGERNKIPTREEVYAFAEEFGVLELADDFYNYWASRHWVTADHEHVMYWKAMFRYMVNNRIPSPKHKRNAMETAMSHDPYNEYDSDYYTALALSF